jgi:hypothetical protein
MSMHCNRLFASLTLALAAQACTSTPSSSHTHADAALDARVGAASGSRCDARARGADCESGSCVDDVCCQTPACGPCERCGATGSCEPVRDAVDDDSCWGTRSCDARGQCVSAFGGPCTSSDECGGGICSWGTCCAQRCGACRTCNGSGECAEVHGGQHLSCSSGHACTSQGECEELALELPEGPDTIRFGEVVGVKRVAQIFSARRAGRLDEIQLRYSCGGQLFAEIHGVSTNSRGIDEPSDVILSRLSQVDFTSARSPLSIFAIEGGLMVDGAESLALVFSTTSACDLHVYSEGSRKLLREQAAGTWTVANSGSLALLALIH